MWIFKFYATFILIFEKKMLQTVYLNLNVNLDDIRLMLWEGGPQFPGPSESIV